MTKSARIQRTQQQQDAPNYPGFGQDKCRTLSYVVSRCSLGYSKNWSILPTEIKQMIIQRSVQGLLEQEIDIATDFVNQMLDSKDIAEKIAFDGSFQPTIGPVWQEYLKSSGRRYDALLRNLIELNRTDLMVLGSPLQMIYKKVNHDCSDNERHLANMDAWAVPAHDLPGLEDWLEDKEATAPPFALGIAGYQTAYVNAFDGIRRLTVIQNAVIFFANRNMVTLSKMPSGIKGKDLVDTAPTCRDKSCSVCNEQAAASSSLIERMNNTSL